MYWNCSRENVLNGNIYQSLVYDFEVRWVSLFVEYGMLEIILVLECMCTLQVEFFKEYMKLCVKS